MYWNVLAAGFYTSITWFAAGGILYMNPWSKKISDSAKNNPAVRIWKSQDSMMWQMYLLGVLVPSMIFSTVFYYVSQALPSNTMIKGIYFGALLIGTWILPRFIHMKLLSAYPNKLLAMDLINGAIASLVIGLTLAYTI